MMSTPAAAPTFYLSFDMEGFSGIAHAGEVFPNGPVQQALYQNALHQVSRTLTPLFEALGPLHAERNFNLLLNDAHASMVNLARAGLALPDFVRLRSGKPKAFGMMSGLETGMRGSILLGYHAKARSLNANLAHTFTDDLADIRLNGVSLGEAGCSALLSQYGFGVPVLLSFGDDALARELSAYPWADWPHVISKHSVGWQCADTLPQSAESLAAKVCDVIKSALDDPPLSPQPLPDFLATPASWELEMQFHSPLVADAAALLPASQRVDGVTLRLPLHLGVEAPSPERIREVYQVIQCTYSLAMYAKFC